jgi:hypothetical protein
MCARGREGKLLGIIPLAIGALAALAFFPSFLGLFVSQELLVEAEVSFSADVPGVKVQWDDPRVITEPFKVAPIPGHSAPTTDWHVRISSTGEHHPDSRSSEVWIFGLETPENRLDPTQVATDGAAQWSIGPDKRAIGGTVYVAAFSGPKTWEATIVGSRLTLHLLNHSWSGKVTITVNGASEDVDLFAPHDGVIVTREYPSATSVPQTMRQGVIRFSVPSGQTYTDELTFASSGGGSLVVLSASSGGRRLEKLGPNKFESPTMGRRQHLYAAAAALAAFILVSFVASLVAPLAKYITLPSGTASQSGMPALLTALGLALALGVWNSVFLSTKVALVNALPSLIGCAIATAVAARLSVGWRVTLLLLWSFLAMRTPLFGGVVWPTLHGAALVLLFLLSFHIIFVSVEGSFERRLIQMGLATIVIVTLTHLGILSPYTYAAIRPIWPDQYVMQIGGVLTNADLPHFMDLFKAYTQPEHVAGFSVVLRRFFYEYLWSTAWPSEPLWMAGVAINILYWFGAMVALLHLARTVVVTRRGLSVVVLGLALSLPFAAVVGQPILYMAAYAWVPVLLWGAVRLAALPSCAGVGLPLFFVAGAVATYDIMPVSAAVIIALLLRKRFSAAFLWVAVSAVVTAAWSHIVLARVLNTFGSPVNVEFLSKSLDAWKAAVVQKDLTAITSYVARGLENSVFAGFGVGFVVVSMLLLTCVRGERSEGRYVALVCLLLTGMYLASSCVIAPQIPLWSPGGLIPRYSYYYFPASLCAYGIIADRAPRWVSCMLIAAHTFLVFADTLGQHEPGMLLHYGNWYGKFQKW